jgi:hypothetical protein
VPRRRIIIEQELESPRGWTFRVRLEDPIPGAGGAPPDIREVRLSWVDHEYWSHGLSGPATVVSALVGILAEHDALDDLGASFDAASARRRFPALDDELPRRL